MGTKRQPVTRPEQVRAPAPTLPGSAGVPPASDLQLAQALPLVKGGRDARAPREGGAGRHSCNWLFKASISAARVLSTPIRDSILRTACSTVVWSRPPKRRPISGNERSVRVLARYIAI